MRLISWNVNGVRAIVKKGFSDFIEKQQPDVLCIQETKISEDKIEDSLTQVWPGAQQWFSAQRKGYSGVASFSKEQPLGYARGLGIDKFDSEGRVLISEYEAFDLYNIYFPNGGMNEERCGYKEEFNDALFDHLAEKLDEGRSLVVVGDYNIAHTELDIYDPLKHAEESGFLPSEREWMDDFLQLGFVDTFRHFHPEVEEAYTWWSYQMRARQTNRGWRIDYICVSEDLIDQVKRAEILADVEGSDHCPVFIEMEV